MNVTHYHAEMASTTSRIGETQNSTDMRVAEASSSLEGINLGNHSAQIELIAIKGKHKVPNGR
jgi:hypothetical protein